MHELSIARAMFELALSRLPKGARLREVELLVGPLQSIDPAAMSWAWAALTETTPHAGCRVHLLAQPWHLACRMCGNRFAAADLDSDCPHCRTARGTFPTGGSELVLNAMEVAGA